MTDNKLTTNQKRNERNKQITNWEISRMTEKLTD